MRLTLFGTPGKSPSNTRAQMPTLSASIVKKGIATVRDVEEALAHQVMYGGDLPTNLLELARIREEDLTLALAEHQNLTPAPIGELPRAPEGLRRLLPGDLALRHGLYPLEEKEGALHIAVSEPLPNEVEQDLSFALGVRVIQRAAPLVRVRQAIARDYGTSLDRRTELILAKLRGDNTIAPASHPGVDLAGFPRPDSILPLAIVNDGRAVFDVPTAPPPLGYPVELPGVTV